MKIFPLFLLTLGILDRPTIFCKTYRFQMLDEDEVGVLGKAVAAAVAENLSADPVVKGLRTFVQTHPALGTTKVSSSYSVSCV